MLSSLKKNSDKTVAVPAWHPNFRNFDRLPDTKAVRTSFFTNGVAVCIALGLLIYTGYREYALAEMRADTAVSLRSIDANKALSDQAIAQFKSFQDEEKKLQALKSFLSVSRLTVSELFLQIGATLPATITLNSIDYKSDFVVLRGRIEGASDEASGQAVSYIEELRKLESYSKLFDDINLTSIVRDPSTGQMRFQVDLKFKASLLKPAPKKS